MWLVLNVLTLVKASHSQSTRSCTQCVHLCLCAGGNLGCHIGLVRRNRLRSSERQEARFTSSVATVLFAENDPFERFCENLGEPKLVD